MEEELKNIKEAKRALRELPGYKAWKIRVQCKICYTYYTSSNKTNHYKSKNHEEGEIKYNESERQRLTNL